ncbi:MMPL family transporter [Metasolibacillus meyeri]|uniref:MMPL family transporter n=1 Tax=Metasolibacillus meyeri TaxID=1071052 RepID=A0AAW9NRE7_9BACL|nr:MMPL family transporter [Metasolibacillus meyeri]MEC1177909.1 MMPL family transporter [Metasolibacillus meyeri]
MKENPLQRFGQIVGGKKGRWAFLAIWFILLVVLTMTLPQINRIENYAGDELPANRMSMEANQLMKEQFSSDAGVPLLIVWYKESGLEIADITTIQAMYAKLEEVPLEGQSALPPFATLPPEALLGAVSENGRSLVTPVFFTTDTNTKSFKMSLEKIASYTEGNPYDKTLGDDGLIARFSGPVAISVDAASLFASADVKLMIATVILILVILLVIYRSPILAFIPIIVVGIAFLVISPLLGYMADNGWIHKDAQAVAIMIVLLFGAGTDYCLFLITKYRDKLLVESNKFIAIAEAVRDSAGAIFMSGFTVVIGLATLALADFGAFQRFAVPFSFGVLITMVAVLTLLPPLLSLLGRNAFFPFVPRTVDEEQRLAQKKGKTYKARSASHAKMRKVGTFVTRKPWLVVVTTSILLLVLAFTSTKIQYNYDLLSSFPEDIQSREGFALIEHNFTAGELAPVKVIVDTAGEPLNIKEQLSDLPYVAAVKEPRVGAQDANIILYEVDLNKNPYSNMAMADVEQMKKDIATFVNREFWIGGETSEQLDTKEVQWHDEKLIQPVMIAIIFAVLLIYLRAVITAVQLMVTVLVSFFAALGLGWLIIHYGLGHEAMASAIPLYSFVFIIALGNDYNIFMISDIWKNKHRGMSYKQAITEGVASTGAVITSAGLILAGTFAVLASLPIQLLVQFGIVTAVGVLLDTFIVRPLLVPALITLFGKWSYWPSRLWKSEVNND